MIPGTTIDLSWGADDLIPVVVLATATVLYLLFHYGASATRWRRRFERNRSPEDAQAAAIFAQRISGAILFGVAPLGVAAALGYSPSELGLGRGHIGATLGCIAVIGSIVVPVVARASRSEGLRANYPEVRATRWTGARVATNALTWALYLLGYEALFRGFLLVPLVDSLGLWPAIAVNTSIYVAVHLTKDVSEASSTAIMGVVFALMALAGGSIWAPFVVHVAVALTSDTISRRSNPEMRRV